MNEKIVKATSIDKIETASNMDVVQWTLKHYPKMSKEFLKIQQEQFQMFCEKNHDYGAENISMGTQMKTDEDKKLSLTALVIRLNDKMSRLLNLIIKKNKKNKNEPIEDSFMDMSIYSIISLIVQRGSWGK